MRDVLAPTIDWMADKTTTPWIDKILKINPRYGEAYETAGHFFVINRRYDEGITAFRKAIELNRLYGPPIANWASR